MTPRFQQLWDAVRDLARACGGDPSRTTTTITAATENSDIDSLFNARDAHMRLSMFIDQLTTGCSLPSRLSDIEAITRYIEGVGGDAALLQAYSNNQVDEARNAVYTALRRYTHEVAADEWELVDVGSAHFTIRLSSAREATYRVSTIAGLDIRCCNHWYYVTVTSALPSIDGLVFWSRADVNTKPLARQLEKMLHQQ